MGPAEGGEGGADSDATDDKENEDAICNVWAHNLDAEFKRIRAIINDYPFISMVISITFQDFYFANYFLKFNFQLLYGNPLLSIFNRKHGDIPLRIFFVLSVKGFFL